ncbi:MAG TPA: TetR/AcrR family transcriptional regulator [Kribbella sp.]|uniref:TetR/AcrR family transcriptional regulator n=1 Tax=Kribbella sp. TaxID=1871183 RepID=UPI002D783AFE|nr:TetR/AcrR family transcriptional regulator [Kribbella sp.]HET6294083.1 TetR/AcrR family transcriptional regulator [Kribbella sp.]
MVTEQGKVQTGRPMSEEVHGAIHRATLELLAEIGYEGLSIAQVARLAGTATTSIYRRFPGKRELVIETLRTEMRSISRDIPVHGSLREELLEYVASIVTLLTPERARIMAGLLLPMRGDPALAKVFREEIMAIRTGSWQQIFDRAVARGEVVENHPGIAFLEEIPPSVIFHRLVVLQLPIEADFISDLVDSFLLVVLTS